MREQILAVQRMQDYIEKNRTGEIRLSDLARASLFSPWYAYRLFRDCLGLTPTEYIRKYRLTQAAKQLRAGNVRVIDAAYDAGFSNVDTFTRAFYREFGLNPSDYMRHPVPVTFFIPYGAKYRELRKEPIDMSNIQPIFIQVVRKPERLCIIKRGQRAEDYFPYPQLHRLCAGVRVCRQRGAGLCERLLAAAGDTVRHEPDRPFSGRRLVGGTHQSVDHPRYGGSEALYHGGG